MTNAKTSGTFKYQSIDFLRFIAAMAVVFVHTPGIAFGKFGVDIFFVISGFIMMVSTESISEKFFLKRLIRILPLYYFFTIILFASVYFFPNLFTSTTANIYNLINSLLFIPFDRDGVGVVPILSQGWTLNYEMFFYAIFAVSLHISHKNRSMISALLIFFIFYYCKSIEFLPLKAYSNLILFEFVFGMAIYELYLGKKVLTATSLLTIVLAAIIVSAESSSAQLIYVGMPSAAFVFFVIFTCKNVQFPKIFSILGGASYALYLTHTYVIQALHGYTMWFSEGIIKQFAAHIFCLLLVNIIAIGVYVFMELPIQKYLRKTYIKL